MNNLEKISEKAKGPEAVKDILREISAEDIKPVVPKIDGTAIVFQCNTPDYRPKKGETEPGPVELGKLTPDAVKQAREISRKFFEETFAQIPEAERKDVSIMVVGASTKLLTETGLQNEAKRAVENAEYVLDEALNVLGELGLSEKQILNKTGKPFEIGQLQDVNFLKDSPEYKQHLIDKYKEGFMFWVAFEEMFEEEKRKELGAEGPEQIADRVKKYLAVLTNGTKMWHEKNPGKRMLVYVVSHRDNMGPYVKKYVTKTGQSVPKEEYLNIKKGGGFVFNVDPNGKNAAIDIKDKHFEVGLGL